MLPEEIRSAVEQELKVQVQSVRHVGGGSVNQTAKIETEKGAAFIKWNDAERFPGMFEAEVKGLQLLAQESGFCIPAVIACRTIGKTAFLLLQFLEPGYTKWQKAGAALASLHQRSAAQFGLDHDNYIGSLPQKNTQHSAWDSFFTTERILPMIELAMNGNLLEKTDRVRAENFCKRIAEIFPAEPPALLHGDLWIGNCMFTANGPSIYDPAVYYGHREMDLAMTKLFGGFDQAFYTAYNESFPLEKDWEKRVRYCNLYPLLVHVNLFGGGYVREVRDILSMF